MLTEDCDREGCAESSTQQQTVQNACCAYQPIVHTLPDNYTARMTEHLVKPTSSSYWGVWNGRLAQEIFRVQQSLNKQTNKHKTNLISPLIFLIKVCSMKYFILVQGKKYPTIALICFQNTKIFLKGTYISFPGKCFPFINKVPSAKDTSYSLN